MAQFARYRLSHQRDDLDKSILHYTEAILLPSMFWTSLNIVETLFHIALALMELSEFERPKDIKYSIEYLLHLRTFPLDSFNVSRTVVTTSLTRALRTQIRAGAGNWTHDIKEMVALCNELLSSNQSEDVPTAAFIYLDEAVTHVELKHGYHLGKPK